jgi:hypothetical protein
MRFPGTRSSTASTVLEQSGQVDQRKADRKRARTARNQQVLGGIGAGLDVLKLAPQFTKIAADQQEGERERAFAAAMEIAQGKSREALQANQLRFGREQMDREEKLERELAPLKYAGNARKPETALERAMAEVQAAQVAGQIADLRKDTSFPPGELPGAIQGLTSGRPTPAYQASIERQKVEAPVRQAAGRSGILDTELAGKLEPGTYKGMGRDDFLALIGNLAIEGGEGNPAIPKVLQAAGGKIPPFPKFPPIGEILNPLNSERDQARSEIQRLIEAIQMQESGPGMTAATGGTPIYSAPPKPLSPATRKYILELRKSLATE